jgi:hypothetical protein
VTDAPPTRVTDDLGVVAAFTVGEADDGATVRVVTPRVVLTRDESARVLAEVEQRTAGAPTVVVFTVDAALREAARAAGYRGGLRSPLRRTPDSASEPVPATVAEWLPDTDVEVRRAAGRLPRLLATGLDQPSRVTARRDGAEVDIVLPLGPNALLEAIAATVDTLLTLTVRLGPVARRVPSMRFSRNGPGMAHGRYAGVNEGGAIVLSPMYVDGTALDAIRRRRDVAIGTGRSPERPRWDRFAVDLVVVHEAGHSVDQAPRSGRLSDTVDARREIGAAFGVETVELALRADWANAPDDWERARERIVADLSLYATTNPVELFAEAFVAWYLREDTPVVAAMDGVLRARYPDLP